MNDQKDQFRNVRIQGSGAVVSEVNKKYLVELYRSIHKIDTLEAEELFLVEQRLSEALKCIDNVRNFVGSPEHILGSEQTKHGEIAEQVDVWFRNAWDSMQGNAHSATFEGVGRTAPEDYLVDGVRVQSKYINGSSNSLSHVLRHLEHYGGLEFGRDGSYYVIPKDQYNEIQRILGGDAGNLSVKTVRAIQEKVREIEAVTGRSFSDAVRPGNVDYAEVQQGSIHKTLDREVAELENYSIEQKETIKQDSTKQRETARHRAEPSWGKAAEAAGISAGISGGLQFASSIHRKCKKGKKLCDFTQDDWKEIGVDTAKATAEGGISGLAIYGMTNLANIPTPIAAGAVSLGFGLVELATEYHNGKISKGEFINGCETVAINSVVCTIGAALGKHLIPIPILGSILGSAIAGNLCNEICGKGMHAAVQNASGYVHGVTISALKAVKEISIYQHITTSNLMIAAGEQNAAADNIDAILTELGGTV